MIRNRVDAELFLDGYTVADFVEQMIKNPSEIEFQQFNPEGDCTVGLLARKKQTAATGA